MQDIAALISAIASLLWPLFAFAALGLYKKQFGDLIARIRKGKLLGQEIELDKSLDKLEQSAVAVAEEVAALPSLADDNPMDRPSEDVCTSIFRESARSPKAALLLLAA